MNHTSNFFYGDASWVDLGSYNEIWYYDLYPGIDLRYYVTDLGLKYDFFVRPGGNPSNIVVTLSPNVDIALTAEGIAVTLNNQPDVIVLADTGLVVYQGDGVQLGGYFRLLRGIPNTYGIVVSEYEHDLPLVIDPYWLGFDTTIAGDGRESTQGMALDSFGNAYITGYTTSSTGFPLVNAYDSNHGGGLYDAFILKLNATGTGVAFSTYIGGTGDDFGRSIAVDSTGNTYITGQTTSSTDFPLVNSHDGNIGGFEDAFVVKLNATGTGVVFSTYIGGTGSDYGFGITVDNEGNAYITGRTGSDSGFPLADAYDGTYGGQGDIFILKLNATGTGAVFSTYIGGSEEDFGNGIAVDTAGNTYITGETRSATGFPLVNAFNSTHGGDRDIFVLKLNATGGDVVFSTYIGGPGPDSGSGVVVDNNGNTYLTGKTGSATGFPVTDAYDRTFGGGGGVYDAFVLKLKVTGTGVVFGTYIGGTGDDHGWSIAIDNSGDTYIVGDTFSVADFPLVNSYDSTYGGGSFDAFILRLSATGTRVEFSTFIGSSGEELGNGIAVDSSGSIYIAGTAGSFAEGTGDAFILKLQSGAKNTTSSSFSNTSIFTTPASTGLASDSDIIIFSTISVDLFGMVSVMALTTSSLV